LFEQAKLLIRQSGKRSTTIGSSPKSPANRLVQLVSGSNGTGAVVPSECAQSWEPFYGAMYLSLDGVNSDNMQAKVGGIFLLVHALVKYC